MKAVLDRFLRLKVDVTDKSDTAAREILTELSVRALPTLIFIGTDGEEYQRLLGEQSSEKLIETARKALAP